MPSFTIELESRCDDYEYADTFIQYSQNIFFKKYESTYNKLYLMTLGVAEKFNKKQSKVLSYMYMIYMLADAIDHLTVSTNDCINDVINETNKALCQLDRKEGIHSDPSLSQAKINRKPITDLKQTTVLLIELLKEDDFNETELLPCEKFIDDFVACLIKEEDRLELLDDAINESVLFYNKWYFIQLAKEVKTGTPTLPNARKRLRMYLEVLQAG